jgi:hypothetical protein
LIMALGRSGILSITAAILLVTTYAFGTFLPAIFELAGVAMVIVVAQCIRSLVYVVWLRPYLAGNDEPAAAGGFLP